MIWHEIFSQEYWIDFWRKASSIIIASAGQIILILILFVVIRLALYKVIDRVLAGLATREAAGRVEAGRAARIRTLQGMVKSIAGYVLAFVASIMILHSLGVDAIPALTTASVAALAVGFGAQLLVRDVITGFFIILENQYAVGDYVTIGTVTGTVEEIGMRITRIRDDVGKLNILANGTVTQVTNHSRGALVAAVDISVPPQADTARAISLFDEVGKGIAKDRGDVHSPFKTEGIVAMDSTKVTFRLAGKVSPTKQEDVAMDLRARLRDRLNSEGIGIV